jgi:hypothetical protein
MKAILSILVGVFQQNRPQAVVQATKFLVPILSILLHLKGAKCSFWVLETIDYN